MSNVRYENRAFSYYVKDKVAVITLKESVVELAIDLEAKERFFTAWSEVEQSPDIGALVLFSTPEALSEEAYGDFVRGILDGAGQRSCTGLPDDDKEMDTIRSSVTLGRRT